MTRWILLILVGVTCVQILGCPAPDSFAPCCGLPTFNSYDFDIGAITSPQSISSVSPSRVTLKGNNVDCVVWVFPQAGKTATAELSNDGVLHVRGNYSAIYISGNWPVIETAHTSAAASGLTGVVLVEPGESGEFVYNAAAVQAGSQIGVGAQFDQPISIGEYRLMTNQTAGPATALSQVEPDGGTVSNDVEQLLELVSELESQLAAATGK